MYSEYLKERTDKHIIESDKGFVVYSFTEDACYIEDVWIKPDFRRSRECFNFGDIVSGIAKQKGFKKLFGSVVTNTKNSAESMQMLLAYGFKLDSANNNFILLKKDI